MTDDKVRVMEQFYTSFANHDYAGMIACYHPDIEFSDPVFQALKGKQVGAMWHMLVERGQDMQIVFRDAHTHGEVGHTHWEATYTFSTTGRHVVNIIDGTFQFRDSKISRHQDKFDFWRWTRMALGTTGVLFGWSPFVQNTVRANGMAGLAAFIAKHPEYQ